MTSTYVPLHHATETLQMKWNSKNSFAFEGNFKPGLYTFFLQAEMKDFDWEHLWMPLNLYGNTGQVTGPWDFNLYEKNAPLLPTWRLHRNDRTVGLFYMQRPTVEDLREKRLRGEFGFLVEKAGLVRFEASPYNTFTMKPIAACLEISAFDRLEPFPWLNKGLEANWAWQVARRIEHDRIAGIARSKPFAQLFDWALAQALGDDTHLAEQKHLNDSLIPLLIFHYRCTGDERALQAALTGVQGLLDRPAWGNPNPDGYSHNGDMGAALAMQSMVLSINWLHAELGELREPVLERAVKQFDTFLEQQLLHSQYWGGAILQDHGVRSTTSALFSALCLLGHTPRAELYVSFYLPRFRRILAARPTDGFIPFSSYHLVDLYVDLMSWTREAMRHATGEDIYAHDNLRHVPAQALHSMDAESMLGHYCSTRGDRTNFIHGLPFFLGMAGDHGDEHAAYLAQLLLDYYQKHELKLPALRGGFNTGAHANLPLAVLNFREKAVSASCPAQAKLKVYPDSGALHWAEPACRFHVSAQCMPNSSAFHCLGTDLTGTDTMMHNPSAGQFTVGVGGEALIQCAESGYRTQSRLANVLLADGKGQYGDVDYTMAVPMERWRGQRIQTWRYDTETENGFVRMNLAPAYPDELELLTYTRDFYFAHGELLVRDTVIARNRHCFAYWFNTYDSHETPVRDSIVDFIGRDARLRMEVIGRNWTISVAPTEVVRSYVDDNQGESFKHVQVEGAEPVRDFCIEFRITPELIAG